MRYENPIKLNEIQESIIILSRTVYALDGIWKLYQDEQFYESTDPMIIVEVIVVPLLLHVNTFLEEWTKIEKLALKLNDSRLSKSLKVLSPITREIRRKKNLTNILRNKFAAHHLRERNGDFLDHLNFIIETSSSISDISPIIPLVQTVIKMFLGLNLERTNEALAEYRKHYIVVAAVKKLLKDDEVSEDRTKAEEKANPVEKHAELIVAMLEKYMVEFNLSADEAMKNYQKLTEQLVTDDNNREENREQREQRAIKRDEMRDKLCELLKLEIEKSESGNDGGCRNEHESLNVPPFLASKTSGLK